MKVRITGFGYTWIDDEHPLWQIVLVVLVIVLLNLLCCRIYGRYHPQKQD